LPAGGISDLRFSPTERRVLLAWIERDFCTPSELATHLSLDPRHVSNSLGRARDKLDLFTTSQLAVFLDRRTGLRGAPWTEDQRENPADGHGDGRCPSSADPVGVRKK